MRPTLRTQFEIFESAIGGIYAAFVAFAVLGLAIPLWVLSIKRDITPWHILTAPAILIAMAAEVIFLRLVAAAITDRTQPAAIFLAARQRRWWFPFRPIAALWWLAHFLAAAAAMIFIEYWFTHTAFPTDRERTARIVYLAPFILAGSYAANIYLLLIVTALLPQTQSIVSIWRFRLLVDVAITLAAMAIPYFA